MILTHGANSIERGDFVEIGGRKYPFVQIGRQLWIVYNLDYSDANIPIGGLSSSVPKAYYYDQDEATNGWNGRKNNLLYNVPALIYLVQNSSTIFPNGWRVCSNSDMESLIKFAGGASVAGIKLSKGDLDWQSASWNGTDDFGFRWLPAGTRLGSDGRFAALGEEACLITTDRFLYYTFGDGAANSVFEPSLNAASPIRLCKDAYVNIGGRDYPTTKIGNQIWLAENLDLKFAGCNVGNMSTDYSIPRAAYYDNDESTYGENGNKYGLLYNWTAADYINNHLSELGIPDGWHIPSREEWTNLVNFIGTNNGTKLKSTNWNGTDDYGFSALPAGCWFNGFRDKDSYCYLWLSEAFDSQKAHNIIISSASSTTFDKDWMYDGFSIRLVKDA